MIFITQQIIYFNNTLKIIQQISLGTKPFYLKPISYFLNTLNVNNKIENLQKINKAKIIFNDNQINFKNQFGILIKVKTYKLLEHLIQFQ